MLGRRLRATNNHKVWKEALPTEIAFWKDWISKEVIPWQEERRARLDPATPLQDWVRNLVQAPAGATVKLLNVGAGPATVLGKV
jgi:hypothetical protein